MVVGVRGDENRPARPHGEIADVDVGDRIVARPLGIARDQEQIGAARLAGDVVGQRAEPDRRAPSQAARAPGERGPELLLREFDAVLDRLAVLLDEFLGNIAVTIDEWRGLARGDADRFGLETFREAAGDVQQIGVATFEA